MKDHTVTIGEAAARTGLTAKAIRLYERRGLLGAPDRNQSGYRTYGANDLAVLSFIRQARNLGLRLDEIGRVLELQRSNEQPCSTVLELLNERIANIDRTMTDLRARRKVMTTARAGASDAARSGHTAVICKLIEFSA